MEGVRVAGMARNLGRRAAGALLSTGLDRGEVAYGPLPHQRLLTWIPRRPSHRKEGCLLIFHGGGYRTGQPEDLASFAPRFARRGLPTAAPAYGLAPLHPFPAAVEDGRRALDHAARLFPGPVRVLGFSAGGHLALLLGEDPRVDAVCAVAAPTLPLPGIPEEHAPTLRGRLQARRVLLVHGTGDTVVPFDHALALHARYPHARILPIQGGDHDIRHPLWAAWRAKAAMVAFLT